MIQKYRRIWGIIFLAFTLAACNATRHLKEGAYLLKSDPRVKTEGSIKAQDISGAVNTRSNKRILIPKTYLHLYNLGLTLEQDSSWLKRKLVEVPFFNKPYQQTTHWLISDIGEAPVLVHPEMITQDSVSLFNASFALGYLRPKISYEIDTLHPFFSRKKANITYIVEGDQRAYISDVAFVLEGGTDSIQAPGWEAFLAAYDTAQCLLTKNGPHPYSHELLINERTRATEALRNAGYFTFSPGLIEFSVDTSLQTASDASRRPLAVSVNIREISPVFTIGEVTVQLRAASDPPGIDTVFKVVLKAETLSDADRELLKIPPRKFSDQLPMTFVVTHQLARNVNFNFIARRILLREGELYRQTLARLTQLRIDELGMFQLAAINYEPDPVAGVLDVEITLQAAPKYQLKLGGETFTDYDISTSANLPVVGASAGIRNKNAFGRSELLELNANGNLGFYSSQLDKSNFEQVFYEVGGNMSLTVPRFMLPIGQKLGLRLIRYSPVTQFKLSMRQETRNEFDRLITGASLSYRWSHIQPSSRRAISSQFTPLAFDFININIRDQVLQDKVAALPLAIQRDYEPHFSSRAVYRFTYSTYMRTRARPTQFIQTQLEWGGNLPYLLDKYIIKDGEGDDHRLRNRLFYGQYVKTALEYKHFFPVGDQAAWVLRGYIGAAFPYNTRRDSMPTPYLHIPFESRFFSGGANSMRGWRSNTLGPGRLPLSELQNEPVSNSASSLLAPGGEYIIELNAEYRFDVYSYLKMALFTDIGNVWFNQPIETLSPGSDSRGISTLTRRNFLPGWDAGIGFRFDFSFLILRLDLGQQLFAPDKGWVLKKFPKDIGGSSMQYNLGIGYPF